MSDTSDDTDLPDTSTDIEVEIPEDTAAQGTAEPKAPNEPENSADSGASDDDLAGYSDKVRKRINKLTYERAEERRKNAAIAAERDEAINYAKSVHAEAERLRKIVEQGEPVLINQVKQRLESQLAQAQAKWQQAYEAGDSAALAQATTEVSRITAEKARVDAMPARKPGPALAPPPVPAADMQPDAKLSEWTARNPWFTSNPRMRGFALGVHEELIDAGVDPNSDSYYARIESAVKQQFPDKFDAGVSDERAPRRAASVVAPASRDTGVAPRKVTLSASEVAIARRLGVTPEQYAAHKLKLKV